MHYDPRIDLKPAPLRFNPLNALVAPRPIGWITSMDREGRVNLAPFSYFNAFSADPPIVGFAPNAHSNGGGKDTLRNVQAVPEFTASIVSADLARQMNETSRQLPYGENELIAAGLTAVASKFVRTPRVAEARAALECRVFEIVALPAGTDGRGSHLVLGEVVGVYIDDALIGSNGRVDSIALAQVARLGYHDYTNVAAIYEMRRPD
ncbi:MAG TPA: flavin reductase family protein [Pseudomonadales bacterium]|jgi:flavin reductase (DIM6/NTAB) family NADH-FMN oxidoreductase RutF|nr:flavin reductase family protein [Pseudomonadales bacterium]